MNTQVLHLHSGDPRLPKSILTWRILQFFLWLVGAFILFCLFIYPATGILLFWNVLIPLAPALLVISTGLWRNLCPLASTQLLPRHWGLSRRKILAPSQLGKLNLAGIILLYLIVPLRHPIFNNNGPATGLMLVTLASIGVGLGLFYEWKSAWCSGLCPIHPVEKLYGQKTLITLPNAHCHQCMNCVIPCPDSTPNINPHASTKTVYHRISGILIEGGLPGFIWGWFQMPDQLHLITFQRLPGFYFLPIMGMMVSLLLYMLLVNLVPRPWHIKITEIFAAAAVSCYYWYRIPSLLGFANFGKDGVLVDLSHRIPAVLVQGIIMATSLFFFYWLVLRKRNQKSWSMRPEFGFRKGQEKETLPQKISA